MKKKISNLKNGIPDENDDARFNEKNKLIKKKVLTK
jgi:hypothetical protein